MADDVCNTAIESFQTDRLLRVFHSCYFHYSEQLVNEITIKNKTFSNSFFVRTLSHWNRLPEHCRIICEPGNFRAHIMENFWSSVKSRINELNQDDVTVDREPD